MNPRFLELNCHVQTCFDNVHQGLAYSVGVVRPPDLFEAFNIGPDVVDEDDPIISKERHRFFAPNVWPDDDIPSLRQDVITQRYIHDN